MNAERQKIEVDRNYDAFTRVLGQLLTEHRDRYALMRDEKVIEIFDNPGDANVAGSDRFSDSVYSIQEITDEPIDLGFWSHVAHD